MSASRDEKQKSHERIVESAAKLLREQGVEGASVAETMKAAGMTHGGFYKHFSSKDDLLAAALDQAFEEIAGMLQPGASPGEARAIAPQFQTFYLSDNHLGSPGYGCPIAALSGDVARSAMALKSRFGIGVKRIVTLLARGLPGSEKTRRDRATRQLAMMAGAIMIARASDADTARDVLKSCRAARA